MLGSAFDADDAAQETLVKAWRNADQFEGRSSVRTWLYRIATNVCLDQLADRKRRMRPVDDVPRGAVDDALTTREREHWLEPIPDARALPADASPHELAVLRQSIRLAFVAALQHLPPRQRAVLILTEVLGWSAAETAACLSSSVASVNSALQRARATLATASAAAPLEAPGRGLSADDERLLAKYVDAFTAYDIDALVSLLRDDATLSMPPFRFWLQGHDAIRAWLTGRGRGCRGSRLLPVRASGVPAFAQYRVDPEGRFYAWAIIVLECAGGRVSAINSYLDVEKLFPLFDVPLTLPSGPGD